MADAGTGEPKPPDGVRPANSLDQEKVIEWIDKHWQGERACPISGHKVWSLTTDVAMISIGTPDGQTELGRYPLIMLTCEACGYMMLFDAFRIGVIQPPPTGDERGGSDGE